MNAKRLRNRVLYWFGLERCYKPGPLVNRQHLLLLDNLLEWAIASCLSEDPAFQFIQVGGFDGVSNDSLHRPVRKYHLPGVIAEPQREVFRRLRANYAGQPQVQLVNAAVSQSREPRTLYTLPGGAGTASFNAGHLTKHSATKKDLIEETVACVTFEDLVERCQPGPVQLVQIDAEGYDFEILKMIDYDRLRPRIVRYEQFHLSPDEKDRAIHMLAEKGYRFHTDRLNVLAFRDAA